MATEQRVRQPVRLTKHGKPRGIPNANCKSTDVGWTGTPIKKLLTQKSKLRSDQTQSGRFTALQLKESTKSNPCTQKGRVAHIHSYVLGGETGPSLLDETTLSFLDGQAMTAHAALCLCHESTWQSQRCLARTKMDGLTQSVDEKMQSKVDTSTVDGKYNQSGSIWKELSGGFHCPPYPPNSKLGYSG